MLNRGTVVTSIVHVVMVTLLTLSDLPRVQGHAKMTEPPMRATMWRYGFPTPVNYDDNELFCGGLHKFMANEGKCGTCGDAFDDPTPAQEAGGAFATGIIVRYFPAGAYRIPVTVDITAFHEGYFEFRLCANNNVTKRVQQSCLDSNLLEVEEGYLQGNPYRVYPNDKGVWKGTVRIPEGMTCTQCVLQMTYKTGNSWGQGHNDTEACLGCGYQEQFQNCADISIGYPEPPSTTTTAATSSSTSHTTSSTTSYAKPHTTPYSASYVTPQQISAGYVKSGSDVTGHDSSSALTKYSITHGRAKVVDINGKVSIGAMDTHSHKHINENVGVVSRELQHLEHSEMILTDIEQRVFKLERTLSDNVYSQRANHVEDIELKRKLGSMMIKMKRLESRMKYMEKIIDIMNAKLTILEPIVDVVSTNQRLIHGLLMRDLPYPGMQRKDNDDKGRLGERMNDRTIDKHIAYIEDKSESRLVPNVAHSYNTYLRMSSTPNDDKAQQDNTNTINSHINKKDVKQTQTTVKQDERTGDGAFPKTKHVSVTQGATEHLINKEKDALTIANYERSRQDVRLAQYVAPNAKKERTNKLLDNTHNESESNITYDVDKQMNQNLRSLGREKPLSEILLNRFPAIAAWMNDKPIQAQDNSAIKKIPG